MNRQTQPTGNLGEGQEIVPEESAQIVESEQLAESSEGRGLGHWLFVGMLLGIASVLWVLGLFPSILYTDTVGSIGSLVPMIPRIDIIIIVMIWMAALVIGLLGRRARHVSQTSISS